MTWQHWVSLGLAAIAAGLWVYWMYWFVEHERERRRRERADAIVRRVVWSARLDAESDLERDRR